MPSVAEEEYAQATKVTPAAEQASTEVKTPEPQPAPPAPEVAVVETPKPVETPAVVEPAPAAPARTEPVEPRRSEPVAATNDTLPATASPLPVLGLLGFLSVGFGALLRSLRSRLS